jgi:hypothetical protein
VRCSLLLLAGCALFNGAGSSARAADLPKEIRTADDTSPYANEISNYVQDRVNTISSDADPVQTEKSRESLLDEVRGLTPPSADFLNRYSKQLSVSLPPLLSPSVNVRVRLNVAIVVAGVAQASQDAQLAQLVIQELNDPSEAVVLWGLKAARDVLPSALGVTNLKLQLIAAISKSAQRLGTGRILNAAYSALAVDIKPGVAPLDLIVPMQNLLNWRIKQYTVAVPPEPPADAIATTFLTERDVWSPNIPQQAATVQALADLIAAAITDLPAAQQDDHDELILLLKKTGEAIFVIGINNADPTLQAAATPLSHIDQRPPPMQPAAAAALAVQGLAVRFPTLRTPAIFATAPSSAPAPK